ncbi:MAG TPA: CBS domain-containing protein, partial [Gaiellaceae bacterium]|nr:CBS domain-containing protein [Gaiellaceae bacterium]
MEIRLLGTAGVHATAEVPVAALEDTAGAVRERLANTAFESVADVAVCDGECLAGLVRLEWLLAAREDVLIRDLMDPDPPVVGPGVDQEVAAWRMVEHGQSSLAVVDGDGRFLGLIPPNRMLGVLLQEHDEDLARLAGVLHGTEAAREAGVEPVGRR